MNIEQLQELEQRLDQIRRELIERDEHSRAAAKRGKVDKCAVDRLSRMDLVQAREMAVEAERRRQERLREVAGALERLKQGNYGHCFGCGQEIDIRRLKSDPATTHCMACAQVH
ncbi:TraR/DksA family transcriptional regulator [Gilvimarinus sp. F26214L]|uniref:TraR/DksA family transcriptional regulator n=1 Tax=Gilvimarinus sp. DZF01 TaxID=3461371 RepID=UPI0040461006